MPVAGRYGEQEQIRAVSSSVCKLYYKKKKKTGQQYGSAAVRTVVKDRGVQQWGRWYSQAPVGGRYLRNKKKGYSPTGQKKTPTYGTAHPPTTDDAVHPPLTHRPNHYYIQQYSSAAVRTAVHLVRGEQFDGWFLRTLNETGNRRGGVIF